MRSRASSFDDHAQQCAYNCMHLEHVKGGVHAIDRFKQPTNHITGMQVMNCTPAKIRYPAVSINQSIRYMALNQIPKNKRNKKQAPIPRPRPRAPAHPPPPNPDKPRSRRKVNRPFHSPPELPARGAISPSPTAAVGRWKRAATGSKHQKEEKQVGGLSEKPHDPQTLSQNPWEMSGSPRTHVPVTFFALDACVA